MRGEKSGVHKQIKKTTSKALCSLCAGHSLNLVMAATSCSVPSVRNAIDYNKNLNSVDQSVCQARRTFEGYLSI